MILGLDVSTSITGICVLDKEENIVYNSAVDTRKYKNMYEKAEKVKEKLEELKKEYDINSIYIEKSLQSFRSGFSSAKVLSTLSAFNGIVSWFCYEIYGMSPEYISASSARKDCGIKVPKGEKAKPFVLGVLVKEGLISPEYTKKGNPKPIYYDMSDAIVIAKSGFKKSLDNTPHS